MTEAAQLADTEADPSDVMSERLVAPEPIGADLLQTWLGRGHKTGRHCPDCGEDCAPIGITHLAYRFAVCDCGEPEYPHLVEQVWHLTCMIENADALVEETVVRDAIRQLEHYKSPASKLIAAELRLWFQARPASRLAEHME